MRARTSRVARTERPKVVAKPRMGKGKESRLAKILEEWLAEARIRYTHAGE